MLDTHLIDVCSGMHMLRSKLAREIDLETSGFEVEAEIAAQVASIGTITEVPVYYMIRVERQKLSTWQYGFKITISILSFSKVYNPGLFYSMLGGLLIIPTGLMLLESAAELARTGEINRPWFNIGISMFFVSMQAMSIGYISLIVQRSKSRTARRLRRLWILIAHGHKVLGYE